MLAALLGWLLDHPPLARFRFEAGAALAGLAAAVPMLLAFLAVVLFPVGPLRSLKAFTENIIRPLMAPCTLVDLFGISLLAGLGEEMAFRGLFQDLFATWWPTWAAVLMASVLFGLLHAVTPAYAVLATLMGAYLGWVYLATDNLLAPVLAHGVYDFLVLVFLYYGPGSGNIPQEQDEEEQQTSEP